jgi:hypothetical protein
MCTRSAGRPAVPPADVAATSSSPSFERIVGSRRSWRRMARRATAQHERELSQAVRRLAAGVPPVLRATSEPLRGEAEGAVVTLVLSLPGWELTLSGVAAGAAAQLDSAGGSALRLIRTGRYGCFWWIELLDDTAETAREEPLVLLGSQLQLSSGGDGGGLIAPQPPALDVPVGAR